MILPTEGKLVKVITMEYEQKSSKTLLTLALYTQENYENVGISITVKNY